MKRTLLYLSFLLFIIIAILPSGGHTTKVAKYVISLQYTRLTQSNWWTRIEPYNIYLGAIPLHNEGHAEKIIGLGVNSILCLLEDFELEQWITSVVPVKHAKWREAELQVKHIKAADFNPLTREEIEEGIAFLEEEHEKDHLVYVHCKAGRGRSATIVVAFLVKKEHLSIADAIARVKDQRPEINLNRYQIKALEEWYYHNKK